MDVKRPVVLFTSINKLYIWAYIWSIVHSLVSPFFDKYSPAQVKENFEIVKVVIKIEVKQTMQWPKEKWKKDKQWSTKQYTENYKSSNMNAIKNREWIRKGK